MAQLSDDCFAFSGPLMPVDEAERLIRERVTPVAETETVALASAAGRVLAEDLLAHVDLPPFDNSAVDGYAVRHADLARESETRLAVVDRVAAGHTAAHALGRGEAIRVFTGAPMPQGADTVFMQEDCRVEAGVVIVPPGLKLGANRRLAGEDLHSGTLAIPAGRRLGPQHVALAAAIGATDITVRRRVRVALFSTGDEIVEPGSPLRAATLYDSNRRLIAAMLARLGADVTDLGILPDRANDLAAALRSAAAQHDLVITSGGVSTGEADHVREVVEKIGRLVFWRVAIKPGRPVAMGIIQASRNDGPPSRNGGPPSHNGGPHGAAFVGLPGNPVAVFVTFARVVRPLLLRLAGALPEPLVALPVRATFSYRKKKGRREYVRVALNHGADGTIEASKHPRDGAGVITSLTETDGLAELTEDITAIEPGAMIGFLPYAVLM
jgi:molybdopterin molybdotransferase